MTDHEAPRELWSDAELDAAMADLHSDISTDEQALADTRAELLAAAAATGPARIARTAAKENLVSVTEDQPAIRPTDAESGRTPGHRTRWLVAAAAAVALSAGTVVAVDTLTDDQTGPATQAPGERVESASQGLQRDADNAGTVEPGQYRYVKRHSWSATTTQGTAGGKNGPGTPMVTYLSESRSETWIPAEHTDDWHYIGGSTGEYKWLNGSDELADEYEVPLPTESTEEDTSPCGEFFVGGPGEPKSTTVIGEDGDRRDLCTDGDWHNPTPEWIADLPRDPQELLERLRSDAEEPPAGSPVTVDDEAFLLARSALKRHTLPNDVTSALHEALSSMPDIETIEGQANVDGREGTALAMQLGTQQEEIIIDEETGEVIGTRTVLLEANPRAEAGSVLSSTAYSTAVVDDIGERP